jgi:DnaJ-class molecular chaperone
MPNNKKPIVKRLQVCKVCEGHGIVRTVDSTHFGNKIDPVYNTTTDCPVCKGEKIFYA